MMVRSRLEAGPRTEHEPEGLHAELSDEHRLLVADLPANPEHSPNRDGPGRPVVAGVLATP